MLIPYNQRRLKKMSTKNYNINSMSGMDDMEVCTDLGLDPAVAYTPAINTAALDLIHARNVDAEKEANLKEGMTIFEADKKANSFANKAKKDAEKILGRVQKKRGYK